MSMIPRSRLRADHLFAAKGFDGIDPRCFARRESARQERHGEKHDRYRRKGDRICCGDAIDQSGHEACQAGSVPRPKPIPKTVSSIDLPTTILSTSARRAPKAIRIPISWTRWLTL